MLAFPLMIDSSMLRTASRLKPCRCARSLIACWPAGLSCRIVLLALELRFDSDECLKITPLARHRSRGEFKYGAEALARATGFLVNVRPAVASRVPPSLRGHPQDAALCPGLPLFVCPRIHPSQRRTGSSSGAPSERR